MQTRYIELMKVLNRSDNWIPNKNSYLFHKIVYSKEVWVHDIYKKPNIFPEPFDVRLHPGSGKAITGFHLSPPRGAGPVIHNTVMCRGLGVTYKTGFGLDDWIYWHLTHSTPNYRQYNAIAILHALQFPVTHALGFSVFTTRILATDLWQSVTSNHKWSFPFTA
jgi:hypothetical protein